MKDLVLNAQKRNSEEKPSEVRASKMIPAVVYGKNKESISIKLDNSDFIKTFRVAGSSHIISLNVEGQEIDVLVHEFQKAPVTGEFLHVDFYAVTKGEKVHAKIALHFVGNSQAAADGALIQEQTKEIEVKTLPRDLVDFFEVDLSKLEKVGDVIRVSDLNISSKYEVINSADDVVAIATEVRKVVEETPTEEAATAE